MMIVIVIVMCKMMMVMKNMVVMTMMVKMMIMALVVVMIIIKMMRIKNDDDDHDDVDHTLHTIFTVNPGSTIWTQAFLAIFLNICNTQASLTWVTTTYAVLLAVLAFIAIWTCALVIMRVVHVICTVTSIMARLVVAGFVTLVEVIPICCLC